MFAHLTNQEFLNLVEGQPVNDDVYREMIRRLHETDAIDLEKERQIYYDSGYDEAKDDLQSEYEDAEQDAILEGHNEVVECIEYQLKQLGDKKFIKPEDIESWISDFK